MSRSIFCATLMAAIAASACDSGVDDSVCCPTTLRCPSGAVEVSSCETNDCFTVESGCCAVVDCVPASSCSETCTAFEMAVQSCLGSDQALYCRTVNSCGKLLHCESLAVCEGVPSCDAGDETAVGGSCPDQSCYEVVVCGNALTCVDNDPLHHPGGGGAGGAADEGGSGGAS